MEADNIERVAYADCFSGVSGDMFLGALLHAGLDEELLRNEFSKLRLTDAKFDASSTSRQSIGCIKVSISDTRRQELRTLPAIRNILEQSTLPSQVCQKSLEVFQALAEAEARVHGIPVEEVHFHEIGALDTIYDVVGTVIGFYHLNISKLIVSPLPLGNGYVQCAHGRLPLPAPATCELLQNVPVYGVDIQTELVTPTGAALVKVLADDFGPIPSMSIITTGYGAGTHTLPDKQPNLLRLIVGTMRHFDEAQRVTIIETRLDDWNPESFPHLSELLMKGGALDVSLSPNQGKKGRPGFTLQVICKPEDNTTLQSAILSETTAIGLRYRHEQRRTLPRQTISVPTPWGSITAKLVQTPRGEVVYPEYEVCRKTALDNSVPLSEVYRAVYAFQVEK